METQRLNVFAGSYLVFGVPPERIAEIAGMARFDTMMPGGHLLTKGEVASDLIVVLDGRAAIHTPSGEKLAEAGPGSVLGEVALVDDQPRSASVTCVTAVHYARLPAQELRRYMAKNKEVGFLMLANLARVLSNRLRQTNAVVEGLMGRSRDPWDLAT